MQEKILIVNGFERKLIVEPDAFLSDVLREQLHLIGTKVGCAQGQCGGHTSGVGNTPRCNHRHLHCLHHLGQQGHGAHLHTQVV